VAEVENTRLGPPNVTPLITLSLPIRNSPRSNAFPVTRRIFLKHTYLFVLLADLELPRFHLEVLKFDFKVEKNLIFFSKKIDKVKKKKSKEKTFFKMIFY